MKALCSLLLVVVLSGCVSYRVPLMEAQASVSFTRADVDVVDEARGEDWAFGIFPFWLFGPANSRAAAYAVGAATSSAYEVAGADFLLQPRVKTTYYNFVLFDYATAEAFGKGARIRK